MATNPKAPTNKSKRYTAFYDDYVGAQIRLQIFVNIQQTRLIRVMVGYPANV
jgi:hypothetical protein